MRIFLSVLILIFSVQSWTKAGDINDFEIEGISIGDSLLDYFTEDKIKSSVQLTQYPSSDKYIILTFNDLPKFEIYDSIQIDYKKNDKKYVVASIMGTLDFPNNIDACYKKQKTIAEEVTLVFPDAEKFNGKQKKAFDKTGQSTSYLYEFHLLTGDVVQISCDDWSEEMTNKHILKDHLGVSIMSYDFVDFLYNEAY
tara:strand:+ start:174 stop:764 length:591 start_codon:yes stop_codon:yes gene_type:complete